MRCITAPTVRTIVILVIISSIGVTSAAADPPFLSKLLNSRHTGDKDPIQQLAADIDHLEFHIETFGTVVPKQPDVWGQARLTKHRQEYERELELRFREEGFTQTLQAAIRRSDQSFLSMALTVGAAVDGDGNPVSNQASTLINSVSTDVNRSTAPIGVNLGNRFEAGKLSLEPVVEIDQLSRYLQHLNQLRRINEGDDTSDSPGYCLNLVRIPVSVLPGKHTKHGYGAEITLTAESRLTDDLLPNTFRNLIVNDLVDQLAPAITFIVNDPKMSKTLPKLDKNLRELVAIRVKILDLLKQNMTTYSSEEEIIGAFQKLPETEANRRMAADYSEFIVSSESLYNDVDALLGQFAGSLPVTRSRRALAAFPPSQLESIYTRTGIAAICATIYTRFHATSVLTQGTGRIHYSDVASFLLEESNAAYELLEQQVGQHLLPTYCTPELVSDIRTLNFGQVKEKRGRFFQDPMIFSLHRNNPPLVTRTLTWALVVQSALLNDRLMADMREVARSKDCHCHHVEGWLDCYMPQSSPEATEAFKAYVRCRWPIHVFALDPVTQDQNVADVHSLRREMQLAAAVALATGEIRASAAGRFVRRLEQDIETIRLNRTVIAFSHLNDTFGWRFYPRVQTPPTVSNPRAFLQTLWGGPTTRAQRRMLELEPGMRECTALVIAPSFVPYVDIHSRANWFKLTNPREKQLTMEDTMSISRTYQCVQTAMYQMDHSDCYRPADVGQMHRVVEQLDRRLPLQRLLVQVPYENTLGGFELFTTGVTDLAPELTGWYGAPGVDPAQQDSSCDEFDGVSFSGNQCAGTCGGTTMFLTGKGFSVHETQVVAGGRCVPFTLLSRESMRVVIPADVRTFVAQEKRYVATYVATPYGISNYLLIPVVAEAEAQLPAPTGFQFDATSFQATNHPEFKVRIDPAGELVLKHTSSLPLPPTGNGLLRLVLSATRPGDNGEAVKVQFDGGRGKQSDTVQVKILHLQFKNGKIFVPLAEVAAAIEETVKKPVNDGKNFTIKVNGFVKFGQWPAETLLNSFNIVVTDEKPAEEVQRGPATPDMGAQFMRLPPLGDRATPSPRFLRSAPRASHNLEFRR